MKNNIKQNDLPLISVIIPVYNPGIHLYKCLKSIVEQSYYNLEIILIDDGSTDGSGAVCDEFAQKDRRITCIHQTNSGVSKARNRGLKVARGEYIHFPDSDDYLELDTYEYLMGLMNQHQCQVVNFEHFITYSDKEIAHSFPKERYGMFNVEGTHKQLMNGVQFCCNKLFHKNLIMGNSETERLFFREDIYRGEDTLFAALAIERAEKIWFDARPLYHYVQSEESACRGKFRKTQLSILKLYDAYEPLYKQKYPEIWTDFLLFMEEALIGIYYDMWADAVKFKEEQTLFETVLKKRYHEIKRCKMGKKRRIKFLLFLLSPKMFCCVHKKMHKL